MRNEIEDFQRNIAGTEFVTANGFVGVVTKRIRFSTKRLGRSRKTEVLSQDTRERKMARMKSASGKIPRDYER